MRERIEGRKGMGKVERGRIKRERWLTTKVVEKNCAVLKIKKPWSWTLANSDTA